MKKIIAVLMVLSLVLLMGCSQSTEKTTVEKTPTTTTTQGADLSGDAELSEIEADLDEIDSLGEDLDMSDLDALDQELDFEI